MRQGAREATEGIDLGHGAGPIPHRRVSGSSNPRWLLLCAIRDLGQEPIHLFFDAEPFPGGSLEVTGPGRIFHLTGHVPYRNGAYVARRTSESVGSASGRIAVLELDSPLKLGTQVAPAVLEDAQDVREELAVATKLT